MDPPRKHASVSTDYAHPELHLTFCVRTLGWKRTVWNPPILD